MKKFLLTGWSAYHQDLVKLMSYVGQLCTSQATKDFQCQFSFTASTQTLLGLLMLPPSGCSMLILSCAVATSPSDVIYKNTIPESNLQSCEQIVLIRNWTCLTKKTKKVIVTYNKNLPKNSSHFLLNVYENTLYRSRTKQ